MVNAPISARRRMSLSDDILVRDTLDGSSEAFRLLVERYRARLFSIACGMLSSEDQAADAVQEAFLKAYRAMGNYRGGAFGGGLGDETTRTAR